MPLSLPCPECGRATPLEEPLPHGGEEVMCACGQPIVVTWPTGAVEKLQARGKKFRERRHVKPAVPVAVSIDDRHPTPAPAPRSTKGQVIPLRPPTEAATSVPTTVDPTVIAQDPPTFGLGDKTVPSSRTPYGALPGNVPEADSPKPIPKLPGKDTDYGDPVTSSDLKTEAYQDLHAARVASSNSPKAPAQKSASKAPALPPAPPPPPATSRNPAPPKAPPPRRPWLRRLMALFVPASSLVLCAGIGTAGGGYLYYSRDLPSVEALQAYEPPTSTLILDKNGEIMGELFEERRYVVPLQQIPDNVQHAFIAAEDANFWSHGGVDYMGMVRAVLRNAASGKKAQGASTITQQVTRNFLLTREKTVTRKIKEILLAWRIEGIYDKEHILYLYLNEIYLGSGAYGVEAAARVYFDKHVEELTIAEAAMLAGLPPAPSQYSPHKNFDIAKERQGYVLEQMVRNGYIDQATADAAAKEELVIVERSNDFLQKAPHFTEHVRRHLVEKYGEDKVLRGGLTVQTTCDLELQKLAQRAVVEQVDEIDQKIGFRRAGLTTLKDDAAIEAHRKEAEARMLKAWAKAKDPAGRVPPPEQSVLEVGASYEAVVLEVKAKWLRVGIGAHEAVITAAASGWVVEPSLWRGWNNPPAVDFTAAADSDGDNKKDGPLVRKGDVVLVRVANLSTRDAKIAKLYAGSPGESRALVAAEMWQDPEIEAALLSYELDTGAVRALVGGADFVESQFIRPTQARRQVGSTFKPIVYAAAIDTRRITAGSMVTDAPLAFSTENDFVWKPGNYGGDYLGNITLRYALMASKNTCTVRVLETIDPGMNQDVIYKFARKLGIGGPPEHALPEGWVATPDTDHLCPWTREEVDSTICFDHSPPRTDTHLSNTAHRAKLTTNDKHMCRACDYSMALGSASLTMEELMRAYSAFGTAGRLIDPYYVEEVKDRHGNVLERHAAIEFPQVIDPGVATITNWLMQGVTSGGTGSAASQLGLTTAGKTGTTNDNKDVWFVGMTPHVITGVWIGYDQPRTIGVSATGGRTALPIWMDYMKVAAPKDRNAGPFKTGGDIEWAQIDDKSGARVSGGGVSYPFLKGTVPESSGAAAGQMTLQEFATEF